MKKHIIGILCLLLFASCSKEEYKHLYSYYYWKTEFKLNTNEEKALASSTKNKVYTRYFDIDKKDGKFFPLAVISKEQSLKCKKEVVPVIFITHRTFINITEDELRFLAKKTFKVINQVKSNNNFNHYDEIQIDYDWTVKTKEDYFKFIKILKEVSNKKITSTLRLHQVKDKDKMGIPPVDKVYLMCYSTSSPLKDTNVNSILNVEILKNYLSEIEDYPIKKISVALPIYSWGIITNHLGKHRLINGISKIDLNRLEFQKLNDSMAIVLKDDFYFGKYMNKGFKIKVEEIPTQQRHEVVRFIENKIGNFDIVYYQLDEKFITQKL